MAKSSDFNGGGGPWWLQKWATTVSPATTEVELDRAAILLAAHASVLVRSPDDVAIQLHRFDAMADRAEAGTFEHWHRLLFVTYGFGGDAEQYHDIRSSFVPDVLERHTGIPIALSVVAMEVGRRLGVPVQGVGMPGHFLVRAVGAVPVYVDPFNGGDVLDEDGCRNRFASIFGDEREFRSEFLEPVTTHQILIRMLANLKSNYARRRDFISLCDIVRMRWFLPDISLDEGRELIRLLGATGRYQAGNDALDELMVAFPDANRLLQEERRRLRTQLN